jgi:vacuolar-type H+-ATPase subunit I/STV1
MEVLLHILLEPLLTAYFSFAESMFEGRKWKKWQENLLKITCFLISFLAIMCVLLGCFWVFDQQPFKTYGAWLLGCGAVVLLFHIVAGNLVQRKVRKREKECERRECLAVLNEREPIVFQVDEREKEN